jgi:hypothetical protein
MDDERQMSCAIVGSGGGPLLLLPSPLPPLPSPLLSLSFCLLLALHIDVRIRSWTRPTLIPDYLGAWELA